MLNSRTHAQAQAARRLAARPNVGTLADAIAASAALAFVARVHGADPTCDVPQAWADSLVVALNAHASALAGIAVLRAGNPGNELRLALVVQDVFRHDVLAQALPPAAAAMH